MHLSYDYAAAACWAAALLDASVATGLILRPWQLGRARPVRVSLRTLLAAALVIAALKLLILPLALAAGLNVFGVIRLVYLDCVLVLPAAGAAVLIAACARRWRVTAGAKALAALAVLAAPVGVYATFIEPYRTQLETATLTLSPARAGREPITVGVLADIQTDRIGAHEEAAVDMLLAQTPDIILIPGDLWQGSNIAGEAPGFRRLLQRLTAPGGVYFSRGNMDWHIPPAELQSIFEGTAVRMLRNEVVRLRLRDRNVTLGGIDDTDAAGRTRVLQQLESAPGQDDVRILSAHLPDTVLLLKPDTRVDLVISGHTHGGQMVVPLIGPLLTLTSVPREVAAGGLHEMSGRRIYVSRGVGSEGGQAPRIRFFCPPEVSIIRLE